MKSLTITIVSTLIFQVSSYSVDINVDPKTAITHVHEFEPWNGERYAFKFETSLGTVRMEEGFLEDSKNGGKSLVQLGFYTTIRDDNQVYLVEYYADETGFNVKSEVPLENVAEGARLSRMVELFDSNQQVMYSLAGNIVMTEGPICKYINCNKLHASVKQWREQRKRLHNPPSSTFPPRTERPPSSTFPPRTERPPSSTYRPSTKWPMIHPTEDLSNVIRKTLLAPAGHAMDKYKIEIDLYKLMKKLAKSMLSLF